MYDSCRKKKIRGSGGGGADSAYFNAFTCFAVPVKTGKYYTLCPNKLLDIFIK